MNLSSLLQLNPLAKIIGFRWGKYVALQALLSFNSIGRSELLNKFLLTAKLKPCKESSFYNSYTQACCDFISNTAKMGERPRYSTNMKQFHEALERSYRIVALCGAGMSAASGLPTFRGAGGIWRNLDAVSLATPGACRLFEWQ